MDNCRDRMVGSTRPIVCVWFIKLANTSSSTNIPLSTADGNLFAIFRKLHLFNGDFTIPHRCLFCLRTVTKCEMVSSTGQATHLKGMLAIKEHHISSTSSSYRPHLYNWPQEAASPCLRRPLHINILLCTTWKPRYCPLNERSAAVLCCCPLLIPTDGKWMTDMEITICETAVSSQRADWSNYGTKHQIEAEF